MFEVVDYRDCNCGEGCPGEKEVILFEHEDKPRCVAFMLEKSVTHPGLSKVLEYKDNNEPGDFRGEELNLVLSRKLSLNYALRSVFDILVSAVRTSY